MITVFKIFHDSSFRALVKRQTFVWQADMERVPLGVRMRNDALA